MNPLHSIFCLYHLQISSNKLPETSQPFAFTDQKHLSTSYFFLMLTEKRGSLWSPTYLQNTGRKRYFASSILGSDSFWKNLERQVLISHPFSGLRIWGWKGISSWRRENKPSQEGDPWALYNFPCRPSLEARSSSPWSNLVITFSLLFLIWIVPAFLFLLCAILRTAPRQKPSPPIHSPLFLSSLLSL